MKRILGLLLFLAQCAHAQLAVFPSSGGGSGATTVAGLSDAGTAAYSNSTAFAAASTVVTTNNLTATNDTRALRHTNSANAFGGDGSLLTALNASSLASGQTPENLFPANIVPVSVIYDDDTGNYLDTPQNLALVFNLHRLGYIKLLAIGCPTPATNGNYSSIAASEVFGNYYGVNPLYGQATNLANSFVSPHLTAYLTNSAGAPFSGFIVDPTKATNVVSTFRKALANSRGNVVMIFTGGLDDLNDLGNSGADEFSDLSGVNLVKAKVSKLVLMAGDYPTGTLSESNLVGTRSDAKQCWTNYPTIPIYWVGYTFGLTVLTMPTYWQNQLDPLGPTYAIQKQQGGGGHGAWDQLAVLYGVFQTNFLGTNLFSTYQGSNTVLASGSNYWTTGTFNQWYLSNAVPVSIISNALNSIEVMPPPYWSRASVLQPPQRMSVNAASGNNSIAYFFQAQGVDTWKWVYDDNGHQMVLRDVVNSRNPFYVDNNTPSDTLYLKSTGNVGVGTGAPWTKLSVGGSVGVAGSVTVTNGGSGNVTIDGTYTGNAGGLSNVPLSALPGVILTNANVNSFVLFTNNKVSFSYSASGVFVWTNYAAANTGFTWNTNGRATFSTGQIIYEDGTVAFVNGTSGNTTLTARNSGNSGMVSALDIQDNGNRHLNYGGQGYGLIVNDLAADPVGVLLVKTNAFASNPSSAIAAQLKWSPGNKLWTLYDGTQNPTNVNQSLLASNLTANGTITATNGVASFKNNATAPTSITVGASVFNYTNTQAVNIQVFLDANGATTAVTFNGTAIFGSLVAGDHTIIMQPGDRIGVTYSVATPIMNYREF